MAFRLEVEQGKNHIAPLEHGWYWMSAAATAIIAGVCSAQAQNSVGIDP